MKSLGGSPRRLVKLQGYQRRRRLSNFDYARFLTACYTSTIRQKSNRTGSCCIGSKAVMRHFTWPGLPQRRLDFPGILTLTAWSCRSQCLQPHLQGWPFNIDLCHHQYWMRSQNGLATADVFACTGRMLLPRQYSLTKAKDVNLRAASSFIIRNMYCWSVSSPRLRHDIGDGCTASLWSNTKTDSIHRSYCPHAFPIALIA